MQEARVAIKQINDALGKEIEHRKSIECERDALLKVYKRFFTVAEMYRLQLTPWEPVLNAARDYRAELGGDDE